MAKTIIQRSWATGNEIADNEFFWYSFGFNAEEVKRYSTDGILNGCLFEFKNNISNFNDVLLQAIKYLSKIRNRGGIPIPSKIALIDISKSEAYIYNSKDYEEYILQNYGVSASKNTTNILLPNSTKNDLISFDIDNINSPKNNDLKKMFDVKIYEKYEVCYPSIIGWANYIYSQDKNCSKGKMFDILKKPVNTILENYVTGLQGEEKDYEKIMDILNDKNNKKDLGAFYTPKLYAKEALKLVRKAIKKIPKNKDYIILDRCAGTGNLEEFLTEEELSHVILNTYEIKEWWVLYQKFSDKVRGIIPPFVNVQNKITDLVEGGDALSDVFLDTPIETRHSKKTLREYIDDENIVIIGLENPPYSDENARSQEGIKKDKNKYSFIRQEMVKDKGINGNNAKDLANQFIWSFKKYFMRNPYDVYIVFSPIKYWKTANIMNKKLIGGFLANRGNFKATESAITVCCWSNKDDNSKIIKLPVYEIQKDGKKHKTGVNVDAISIPDDAELVKIKDINVKKVYNTLGILYSLKDTSDVASNIVTDYAGKERIKYNNKNVAKNVYNENIIGVLEASGFWLTPQDNRLVRIALYHGRGSQIRTYNYHEQLPLFVAKNFPKEGWYEDGILASTADDKAKKFLTDQDFLRKCIIWSCLTRKNHCLSFTGSDNIEYKNELCFDDRSLIYDEVVNKNKYGQLDHEDEMILGIFKELFGLAKKTDEYKKMPKFYTLGTYQISLDINTSYIDSSDKKVYNYPKVNTKLLELNKRLSDYLWNLRDKLLAYELIK